MKFGGTFRQQANTFGVPTLVGSFLRPLGRFRLKSVHRTRCFAHTALERRANSVFQHVGFGRRNVGFGPVQKLATHGVFA
jgi:hypothetical protein